MERVRQSTAPPARARKNARDAQREARWRVLALRWWRAHAKHVQLVQQVMPVNFVQHVPSWDTHQFYYNADDFREMMQLGRLVRGARPAPAQWERGAAAAAAWRPGDPQLQIRAGAIAVGGAPPQSGVGGGGGGGGGETGLAMLLLLLGVLVVRLSGKCVHKLLQARACSDRHGGSVPAISSWCIDELGTDESDSSLDQPPPYSLLVEAGANPGANPAGPKPEPEEPPPPYSECFVALKGVQLASEPQGDVVGDLGDVPSVGVVPEGGSSALCGCYECDALRQAGTPGDAAETCV